MGFSSTDLGQRSLIFESSETGHRSEYVSFLMRFIISEPELHGKYTFLLNKMIHSRILHLIDSDAFVIRYFEFANTYGNAMKKSFVDWEIVSKVIASEACFKEIIFLDIDPFLFLLTTRRFKALDLSVKGILFQPYKHFQEKKGGFWFFIRHVLRSYFFQRYSTFLNPKIEKLFILNDRECTLGMNKEIKNVFFFLPDPIACDRREVARGTTDEILTKYRIRPEQKNLLLFGAIDSRKNLFNILDSLLLLPPGVKKGIHFIIAGTFQKELKETYLAHIEKCSKEFSIVYYDEFVSDDEREVLFEHCQLVLMPYINFYSSSGVLGHAIKHHKNVVASKEGLVGRVVSENQLGITVNPLKVQEISRAILDMLDKKKNHQYNSEKLLKENHPDNFSKTLLLS